MKLIPTFAIGAVAAAAVAGTLLAARHHSAPKSSATPVTTTCDSDEPLTTSCKSGAGSSRLKALTARPAADTTAAPAISSAQP